MTTGLGEFLLARIAEDEHETRWMGTCDCAIEGFPLQHGLRCPERVLAECEAKRRIVEEMVNEVDQDQAEEWFTIADRVTWMKPAQLWLYTLQCLALPYADHPDYREEWRP